MVANMSTPPSQCVHHPGTPAAGICARCGDFICEQCRHHDNTGRVLCAPCYGRQVDSGAVGQLNVFGILMIVHGALLILMGLMDLVGIAMVPSLGMNLGNDPSMAQSPLGEGGLTAIMFGVYGALSLAHIIPAGLQIFAGIRVLKHRSRTLAIVALSAGLLSLFGCYCAPTSLALFVYGLVLLLRGDVIEAFRRGEGAVDLESGR